MKRRNVLLSASLSALTLRGQARDYTDEVQFGDPSLAPQAVRIPINKHKSLLDPGRALGVAKSPKAFAMQLQATAKRYIGKSQWTEPGLIEDFFSIFDFPPRNDKGEFQPFCAAGLSFAACEAYCEVQPSRTYSIENRLEVLKDTLPDIQKYYFKPEISVLRMKSDAIARGKWVVSRKVGPDLLAMPSPGWLVAFDWNADGAADHVGLVLSASASSVHTLEFNTSLGSGGDQGRGGHIVERDRGWSLIDGFLAIDRETA